MSVWACANRLVGYKSIAAAEPGDVSKHSRKHTFALNSAGKYDDADDWHTVYSRATFCISFLSGDIDLGYVSLLSLVELVKT